MTMHPSEAAGRTDYRSIALRLGGDMLRKRIYKQARLWEWNEHQGVGIWALEGLLPMDRLISGILRVCGVEKLGNKNYLDVRVVENIVEIPSLPPAFDGYRLLQIADLHCDLDPRIIDSVLSLLPGVAYDAVALTGDYQNKIARNPESALALMQRLISHLHPVIVGILGNHDFIEKVAFLEDAGVRMLLNENLSIEREGRRIWICGVDDPHFFRTEDLLKARNGIPGNETAILLSHSPETAWKAAELGYSFQISGHTHGGQFCLPGRIPIIRNTRVPRNMLLGPWKVGKMPGYTSPGTGACQVAARFFCPPEITIHILKHPSGV